MVADNVIFNMHITHDGVSVSYDQELLHDIWHAFQRGYKRRIGRFKNNFMAGMFPANTITISIVIAAISLLRLSIKLLLSYKGWMYEQPGKPISTPTKLWLGLLNLMSKSGPMMHSYQGALPHLPLPSLNDTIERHLLSMRPILNDEEFEELEHLSEVTDWWEEFVYMRQRSPIMIN
ncbi:hypothetical protein ANCDUO_15765, partial [Ancylostoma duodenale]